MITRRAALAGGAALLLGAPAARAQVTGDAALLERLLRLEQLAVAGYGAAATAAVLDEDNATLAAAIVVHERQHADVLAVQLEAFGGTRPPEPQDLTAADAVASELGLETLTGGLRSDGAFLEWAETLELRTIAALVEGVRRGLDIGLVQTLLSILGAEGQHLAAVRTARGRRPVARAFESGA